MRVVLVLLLLSSFALPSLFAHCDTLSGPVVTAARAALDSGNITPLLRWVQPQDERERRAAFDRAVAVRKTGPEARALAPASRSRWWVAMPNWL